MACRVAQVSPLASDQQPIQVFVVWIAIFKPKRRQVVAIPAAEDLRNRIFLRAANQNGNTPPIALFIVEVVVNQRGLPKYPLADINRHFVFDAPSVFALMV
jgi:hypothetical protein